MNITVSDPIYQTDVIYDGPLSDINIITGVFPAIGTYADGEDVAGFVHVTNDGAWFERFSV